ncbi:glycosyltransferase [Niabella sp.]|uniref:glycosyltransferase n=1 Tax=Niabella sp. TaxID=1962976 RepID=UPI00262BFF0E|nr:glycosyltransferase [Niabella sp.]
MKFAAVVITYFPGNDFWGNIATYLNEMDRLYIFDNSEPSYSFPQEISQDPKIILIADGVNRGIATRLNAAVTRAADEDFDWLLTMDQDSRFDKEQLQQYISNIKHFEKLETVAMFGVETERAPQPPSTVFKPSRLLITSGSMVNLHLAGQIGGFDEQLFIDGVDHAYCFQAAKRGFETLCFTGIYLNHNLGTKHTVRSLKNLQKTSRTLHAPFRLYYMYRNFLYLSKIYGMDFPEAFALLKKDLYNRIKNHLFYGSEKRRVLKAILKARKDFRTGRMGRQPLN